MSENLIIRKAQLAERWCYQQGATRIQLLADRENEPALRFYAKLGWEKTQLICKPK